MYRCGFAEMTFTLAILLGENMAQVRVPSLETTAGGALKTLSGATICLEFWQCYNLVTLITRDSIWD